MAGLEQPDYVKKTREYLNLNYSMIFKSKELFSTENIKAYNTLKSFEKRIPNLHTEMQNSVEGVAHFLPLTGRQSNVVSLESLARHTLESLDRININPFIKESFKKELTQLKERGYTEDEIYPVMDKYLHQIASSITDETHVKPSHKSDYIIARTFYYLMMASPILIIAGYMMF